MASAVTWIFKMIDKVTAPASAAQKRLEAVEKTIKRVEQAVRVSGGSFGGWAKQGEHAAQRVERAMGSVQKRFEGMGRRLSGLQNMYWNGMLAVAPLVGVGYAGKQIADAAAYKQNTLINLRGLLGGDAGKAGKLFDQAQLFAALTPFSTEQVINATSQALAIGFKDRQAIPLVKLAGQLSAGSGKSMDQVMEAFAALRGGDFGQAFGVGQGFSNLNISRDMLSKAGLKFSASGEYQGNVTQGLAAVAKIIRKTYGTAMAEQGLSLSGLASTLSSRPQELFMSLVDNKGQSKAMKPLQDFMANLAELTDFSTGPGAKIQKRFEASMTKLFGAIFNPLANATNSKNGPELIDRLLDKVDQFSAWAEQHGPAIMANLKGFGEGFKAVADAVLVLIKPVEWLFKLFDKSGDSSGLIGKLIGGAVGLSVLNNLTGGLLGTGVGKMFRRATRSGAEEGDGEAGSHRLSGHLKIAKTIAGALGMDGASSVLEKMDSFLSDDVTGGLTNSLWDKAAPHVSKQITAGYTRFRRLRMTGRGFGTAVRGGLSIFSSGLIPPSMLTRVLPIMGRLAPLMGLLTNPITLAVAGIVALGAGAVYLYNHFKPFRNFVDGLADKFREGVRWVKSIGVELLRSLTNLWDRLPDNVKKVLGYIIPGLNFGMSLAHNAVAANTPLVIPNGGNRSVAALTGVANTLGINPADLLAVAFKESSLNPAARNKDSNASGLIQFLPSTAKAYGLTPEQVRGMTPEQQAPFILRYLKEAGVKPGSSLEQIYSAVFAGNASKAGNLRYMAGTPFYDDNKGMDLNGDKVITSDELARAAQMAWTQAAPTFAPSVTVNNYAPVTPEGLRQIGDSTSQVLHNYSVEQGYGGQR